MGLLRHHLTRAEENQRFRGISGAKPREMRSSTGAADPETDIPMLMYQEFAIAARPKTGALTSVLGLRHIQNLRPKTKDLTLHPSIHVD
jgi:hypothetical protein